MRYSALVMEHFDAPRNVGAIADADAIGEANFKGRAPRVKLFLTLERTAVLETSTVEQVGFLAFGCGATIAACSALTELVKGSAVVKCRAITAANVEKALGGLPPEKRFCASIAVAALHDGLAKLSACGPAA